ncbi:hypothetical protein [Sabulicella glaciei]|uniref:Uncharacterized protein n=1 Tax=Sabulicella glaciei TaxID=2984948 RepID=A0ABT3P262_9PROT|nr:hypothetical protein [Roseococcus sp. MDT2-1-1]MCW8088486.1 hypothetical protein [Roseococcus sp. MDT2-1-1]
MQVDAGRLSGWRGLCAGSRSIGLWLAWLLHRDLRLARLLHRHLGLRLLDIHLGSRLLHRDLWFRLTHRHLRSRLLHRNLRSRLLDGDLWRRLLHRDLSPRARGTTSATRLRLALGLSGLGRLTASWLLGRSRRQYTHGKHGGTGEQQGPSGKLGRNCHFFQAIVRVATSHLLPPSPAGTPGADERWIAFCIPTYQGEVVFLFLG